MKSQSHKNHYLKLFQFLVELHITASYNENTCFFNKAGNIFQTMLIFMNITVIRIGA